MQKLGAHTRLGIIIIQLYVCTLENDCINKLIFFCISLLSAKWKNTLLHPSPQHTDLRQFTLVFLVKRQVLTMIEQLLPHQHCYWMQFDCWHRLCAFRGQSSQRRGVGWGDHWKMDQRMLDRHSSQPLGLFECCRNTNVHVCVHMCVCLKFNVFREELQENFAKVKIFLACALLE